MSRGVAHFVELAFIAVLIALWRPAHAQDTSPFRATAVEATEREAILEAYFHGLTSELSLLAGGQAQTGMGEELHDVMQRDFESFRRRFFTADTDHRCAEQSGRIACEVQGAVKVSALKAEVRKSIRTTEQTLSNTLTYALTAATTKDPAAPLVIDQLVGAFAASGHKVLTAGAVNAAIDKGQIDYSLAVNQIEFSPFAYIAGERRAEGSLTVRFGLLDVRRKLQVAVLPVVVSATVTGPSLEPVQAELRGELAAKAAMEIARQSNNAIVTAQEERSHDQVAVQRRQTGGILYLVRLEGVAQRDRDRIRVVREALLRILPGAEIGVDPQLSSGTQVTIAVTSKRALQIDDVIDGLYEAHRDIKSFEAIPSGTNQIKVHY